MVLGFPQLVGARGENVKAMVEAVKKYGNY